MEHSKKAWYPVLRKRNYNVYKLILLVSFANESLYDSRAA